MLGRNGRCPRRACKVTERGSHAVVLPVLWTGLSEHPHELQVRNDYAGLSDVLQRAVVEDVCRSVLRHGFKLDRSAADAHGGNENALRTITDELTPEARRADRPVHPVNWYAAARIGDREDPGDTIRTDACLRGQETSMMLAVRPELVARWTAWDWRRRTVPDVSDVVGGGAWYRWRTVAARSASGVIGNPEDGDRGERGEKRLFDAIATALARTSCAMWTCGNCPWQA